MILYHGSREVVKSPEIRILRYSKDFYFGFYCTLMREQAKRWAVRFSRKGIVNEYEYVQNFIDGKISRSAFWELAKFK